MRYLTIIFLFITTFATGQQQMFLRSTPAAGVTGILDSYTGAEAAYATALLYSSYGGSCLRVRRDSDNAEQDIGFSGQDIDEAAINSFCSGANCFVKTWYDQSGSGNDATQATAGNQPKIYDSSTGIIYENSVVAVYFDGSDVLRTTSIYLGNSVSGLVVNTPLASPALYFNQMNFSSNERSWSIQQSNDVVVVTYSSRTSGFSASIDNTGNTISLNTQVLHFGILKETSIESFYNSSTDGATSTASWDDFSQPLNLGGVPNSSFGANKMQVSVVYASDQSANRTGIETAINNYFNIYP